MNCKMSLNNHNLDPWQAEAAEQISLCEALDRVLNKGVVISGDLTISVAGVDLIYLGLRLLLTSVETARETGAFQAPLSLVPDSAKEMPAGRGLTSPGRA